MTFPVEHERLVAAVGEGPLHAAGEIVPDDRQKDLHGAPMADGSRSVSIGSSLPAP